MRDIVTGAVGNLGSAIVRNPVANGKAHNARLIFIGSTGAIPQEPKGTLNCADNRDMAEFSPAILPNQPVSGKIPIAPPFNGGSPRRRNTALPPGE